MSAFEVVGGQVKNPGAEFKALTAMSGQTFNVRTTPEGTKTWLEQIWGSNAAGGSARIRSNRMHDNVQGIRLRVPKANQRILLPYAVKEELYNQDVLTVETTGGGAETDDLFYLVHYEKLPGSEGNFRSWAEVEPRVIDYMGVEVTLKSGTAENGWGAAKALNSAMDQFKRPSEYAMLGYLLDAECGAVVIHGTDVGELKVGGPGPVEPDLTGEWFIRLSDEIGVPAIPCFQAANVGSILAEIAHVEEVERHVTFLCARLS